MKYSGEADWQRLQKEKLLSIQIKRRYIFKNQNSK